MDTEKSRELGQLIQLAQDTSKVIIESGQTHIPVLLMITPTEVLNLILSWIDHTKFGIIIEGLLCHFHAYAYVFVDEAWTANLYENSPLLEELKSGRKKIADLPPDDKCESMLITAAENGKSYQVWSAKIRYTRDDKRYLDKWEEQPGYASGPTIIKEWQRR